MSNSFFKFKQFTIHQDKTAMKVTTDACLFGAWIGGEIENRKSKIENLLDIGTGTGLLSLMLAQKSPGVKIDAIEIDKDAADQALENITDSPFKNQIRLIHEDANEFKSDKKYDIIISNPPFYENELSSVNTQKNIAHHDSGLLLQDLLRIISSHLNPTGRFYLMLPFKRNIEAGILIKNHFMQVVQAVYVRQSFKHDFFRVFLEIIPEQNEEIPFEKSELSIWNDQQKYTTEFVELLKDYYLYL